MLSKYKYLIIFFLLLLFIPSSFAGTMTYTYDDRGQIIKVNCTTTTSFEYTYDNIGNRLTQSIVNIPIDTDNDGLPDSLQVSCTPEHGQEQINKMQ